MVRNCFIDNAKVILTLLVVFGHLISGMLKQNENIDIIYMIIYTFHMPAFVYITGALSKKIRTWKQLNKLVLTILVPYLIFQWIYTVYYVSFFDNTIEFEWLTPRMALWYLLSLFAWRILLFIVPESKWSIVGAIIISLVLGNVADVNDWASLSRTVYFFAYFVAGYTIGFSIFEKRTKNTKYFRGLSLVLGVLVIYYFGDISYRGWYLGKESYSEMDNFYFESGALNRLLVYAVGFTMMALFFYWVPAKRRWFTKYGARTLSVYLLHMFFVEAIREGALYDYIEASRQYWILLISAISIMAILSMKVFQNLLSPLKYLKKRKMLSKNASI